MSTDNYVHNRSVVYKSWKDIMPTSGHSCRSAEFTCGLNLKDISSADTLGGSLAGRQIIHREYFDL
jgi:hypothetical protein